MKMRKTLRHTVFCLIFACLCSHTAISAYADGYDLWPEPFIGDALFADPWLNWSSLEQLQPTTEPVSHTPGEISIPLSTTSASSETTSYAPYIPTAMPQNIGLAPSAEGSQAVSEPIISGSLEDSATGTNQRMMQAITNLNTTPTEKAPAKRRNITRSSSASLPAAPDETMEFIGNDVPEGTGTLTLMPLPQDNLAPAEFQDQDPETSDIPVEDVPLMAVPMPIDAKINPGTSDRLMPLYRMILPLIGACFTIFLGRRLLAAKKDL